MCAEAGGVAADRVAVMEAFRKHFEEKHGVEVRLYAPYVYDAVNVLVAAMQKADSTDPKKYLPELAKIRYDGVTGTIAFDRRGDIKDGSLTLYTFREGRKTQLMVTS